MNAASASEPRGPLRRSWRRRVVRWLAVPVGIYLGISILFIAFQRSLMYPAAITPRLAAADHAPAGVVMRDATATTADGLTLHGWHVRPAESEVPDAARPLVLIFHGNGGNRLQTLETAALLAELDADSLVFDYRGYGENAGSPSETGLIADAHAAWHAATTTHGAAPERIVIYGSSLGGAVATRLAADLCDAGTPPAGLVVRSTFGTMAEAAGRHYPWLPVRLALLDTWDSRTAMRRVACPVLVLHGDADRIVPDAMGRSLYDAAPPKSAGGVAKRYVPLPGADHNDVLAVAREPFRRALAEFLGELRPPSDCGQAAP